MWKSTLLTINILSLLPSINLPQVNARVNFDFELTLDPATNLLSVLSLNELFKKLLKSRNGKNMLHVKRFQTIV